MSHRFLFGWAQGRPKAQSDSTWTWPVHLRRWRLFLSIDLLLLFSGLQKMVRRTCSIAQRVGHICNIIYIYISVWNLVKNSLVKRCDMLLCIQGSAKMLGQNMPQQMPKHWSPLVAFMCIQQDQPDKNAPTTIFRQKQRKSRERERDTPYK